MSRSAPRLLGWALRIARAGPSPPAPPATPPVLAIGGANPFRANSLPFPLLFSCSSFASSTSKPRDDARRTRRDTHAPATADGYPSYRHPPREDLDAEVAAALGLYERGTAGRAPRSRAPPLLPSQLPEDEEREQDQRSEDEEEDQEDGRTSTRADRDDQNAALRRRRQEQQQHQQQQQQQQQQNHQRSWLARPTVGARRAASHLESALSSALARDAACRDDLLRAHGLVVHAVRRSPDGREAAVLWDCFPGHEAAAAAALERRAGRLRRAVGAAMRGARVPCPRLVFRLDRLPLRAVEVAQALERAEQELLMVKEDQEEPGRQRGE